MNGRHSLSLSADARVLRLFAEKVIDDDGEARAERTTGFELPKKPPPNGARNCRALPTDATGSHDRRASRTGHRKNRDLRHVCGVRTGLPSPGGAVHHPSNSVRESPPGAAPGRAQLLTHEGFRAWIAESAAAPTRNRVCRFRTRASARPEAVAESSVSRGKSRQSSCACMSGVEEAG